VVNQNLDLLISTRNTDKFKNVGEANLSFGLSGKEYWNRQIKNKLDHKIPGGAYVNGGGLLKDGNGWYALKFVETDNSKNSGFDDGGGDQPNFRLEYDFYTNRRVIIRLIKNSFLP